MKRVALVTCRALPEPDLDEPLLVGALRDAGVEVELVAWDEPRTRWDAYALAVIRSTWNYYRHLDDFLAWAERAAQRTRLLNPVATVRWNADKAYLSQLAARGVRTVPTREIARGSDHDLRVLARDAGWARVVVKPRISAGSFETHSFVVDELVGGELAACARELDLLVQPYVASVDGHGERSLVWIAGELTHAIRKSPRFAKGREAVSPVMPISDAEREFALGVLSKLDEAILYARVDLALDADGAPMLMELELIEPLLFLRQHPPALARLVAAIASA